MIYLREMNFEDALKEFGFLKETPSQNGFVNDFENMSYEDFLLKAIPDTVNSSKGIGLQEGWVPQTCFFLWDDDEIVGLFKVRHFLNDSLRCGAGHIGYAISPKYRRKGYATKGLALAVDELKKLLPEDEREIYMSCKLDNTASLKAQLNNGAYIHHSDEKENYTRIKI